MVPVCYVRVHAPVQKTQDKQLGSDSKKPGTNNAVRPAVVPIDALSPDIQAILTVIGRRESRFEQGRNEILDLSNTNLAKANLNGADLSGAHLNGATLALHYRLAAMDIFGEGQVADDELGGKGWSDWALKQSRQDHGPGVDVDIEPRVRAPAYDVDDCAITDIAGITLYRLRYMVDHPFD
ncbi:MAG: pentapeptide repeat-containing protein [Deltaproteobacteria bacterium]|nr:pentapeptide repeat-containing protein [Deltaproteobacteria bacterium]